MMSAEIFGTAFLVDGTWYARCEGDRGVLVPIEAGKDLRDKFVHGQAYTFDGRRMTDHRGFSQGVHVIGAKKIGTPA